MAALARISCCPFARDYARSFACLMREMAEMTSRLSRMVTVPRMIVVSVVIAVVAATLVTVNTPSGPPPGAGILRPGSQGSLSQLPWWDPRGWFSSGSSQAPSSHVVPGTEAALPAPARVLREVKAPPVRRVRELVGKRTQFSRTYELSNGHQQA